MAFGSTEDCMRSLYCSATSLVCASVLLIQPLSAFDTPLSDTAVREAYFLGQRHDESLTKFLNKYTVFPPPPKVGPSISSVTFFTPYAQVVQLSDLHASGYSAQQAQLDHKGSAESVRITVQIQLTETYGALIPEPQSSRSGGIAIRSSEFWTDFQIAVFDDGNELKPLAFSGHPNYSCSENGCTLTGATIDMMFPASAFESDSATVQIDPPEGQQVLANFNLTSFR
jgi:hypothetical protein